MSAETPSVSVVIPTYNRAEMLVKCVKSVLATGYNPLEVIVVDDCSPDDTRERIASEFGESVVYLRHDQNRLLAATRNTGASAAHGDYIFFIDDDNVVDQNSIEELLACFSRHPDAALVAPLAIQDRIGAPGLIWSLGNDFNRWRSTPANLMENQPLEKLPKDQIDFPTTYSCNAFMVKRSADREIGGADESLVMVYEESDYGWRLREQGYSAWITSRARTTHLGFQDKGSTPQLRLLGIQSPLRTFYFARNRIRFAKRHFSWLQAMSVAFVFAPISIVYYGIIALRNRRPDIAWAYLRGTFAGFRFLLFG